ncbi:MAG: hypothetical protein IKU39_03540 [Lachnospiraceae bacterium]|nr:hypothetical protein [Lachnospiraceae bacterium]
MKKVVKVIGIALVVLVLVLVIATPFVNNYSASKIEKRLTALPLPEKTEYIESISKAGKMTGNGNGMQFLGAMLVQSELTIEELNTYYATYRENQWNCIVEVQKGQTLEFIEHGELSFSTDILPDEGYFVIYSWGNGMKPFEMLDIRGN